MLISLRLFCINLCLNILFIEAFSPRGVSIQRLSFYDPLKDFTCLDGSLTVPFSYVNDDYCDCVDGSDEPGTAACPGGSFYCANKGHKSVYIPSRFVDDGICDCCDGSDEHVKENCTNICEQLGYEARREKERLSQLLMEGSKIRLQMVTSGKHLLESKQERISVLENEQVEAARLKDEAESIKNAIEEKEGAALSVHKAKEDAEKALKAEEERKEELKEARNLFDTYDSNKDEKLQVEELRTRQILDVNKDGAVSDDEIKFITDLGEDVTFEKFMEVVWPRLKPLLAMDKIKVYFPNEQKPGEESLNDPEAVAEGDNLKSHTDDEEGYEEEDDEEEGEGDAEVAVESQKDNKDEPKYDEETRKLIEEANQARSHYDSTVSTLQDLDRELSNLKDFLGKDYGSEDEFATLDGQCFTYNDREYSYKLCPFDQITQTGKTAGSETRLGSYVGWEDKNYSVMLYDKGQPCWNGPQRSTKVTVTCGLENIVNSASEPNKCEYVLAFETPAACKVVERSKDAHDEL